VNLIHRLGLALLLVVAILGLTGCTPKVQHSGQPVSFRLSPFELAIRLGLDVTEQTDRYIEMKNANNRVGFHSRRRAGFVSKSHQQYGPVTHVNRLSICRRF
jgi:hypothetical protein